jgi:hypothetical protein
MLSKLARMLETEIKAFARVKGMNPETEEYRELAERLAAKIEPSVKLPRLKGQCLVADDDWNGGYTNPRIVEWAGSQEEVLYPEDPETGEPVDDRIADYVLPLPDPDFIPEI